MQCTLAISTPSGMLLLATQQKLPSTQAGTFDLPFGVERGIRTLETYFQVCSLSRGVVSTNSRTSTCVQVFSDSQGIKPGCFISAQYAYICLRFGARPWLRSKQVRGMSSNCTLVRLAFMVDALGVEPSTSRLWPLR